MAEVKPGEIEGMKVSGRKIEEGTLTLMPEEGEEVTLVCDCGRHHWLVTTYRDAGALILKLVCHGCQRPIELPYSSSID